MVVQRRGLGSGLSRSNTPKYFHRVNCRLKKMFALIAEELRFQYRPALQPDESQKDGSLHLLSVKVTAPDMPDVVVRARRQYRAADGKP